MCTWDFQGTDAQPGVFPADVLPVADRSANSSVVAASGLSDGVASLGALRGLGSQPPQIQGSTWHSVPSRRGLRCSCVTVNTFLPCRGLVSSWQSGRHKPTLEAFSRDVVRLDNFGGFFRLFGKNKLKGKFSRGENRNTVRVIGTALCQRLVGRQTADERAKHPPPPPSAPWRRSRRGVALRQRNKSHVAHPHGG